MATVCNEPSSEVGLYTCVALSSDDSPDVNRDRVQKEIDRAGVAVVCVSFASSVKREVLRAVPIAKDVPTFLSESEHGVLRSQDLIFLDTALAYCLFAYNFSFAEMLQSAHIVPGWF